MRKYSLGHRAQRRTKMDNREGWRKLKQVTIGGASLLLILLLAASSMAATLADLLPQSISVSPNPATAGGDVTVSYKVTNQGGTAAPASHTKVQIKNAS